MKGTISSSTEMPPWATNGSPLLTKAVRPPANNGRNSGGKAGEGVTVQTPYQ
jgi:hypothetical protein